MTWYDSSLHQMADRLFSLDVSAVAYPLVFAGGLLTNFCPCNVVLIPMMIGYVGGFSRSKERGRAVLYSAVFSAGIILTFCVLGVLASVVGAFIAPFRTVCLWGIALVAALMGVYCLGGIKFRLPGLAQVPAMDRLKRRGLWAALVVGMAGGVVATPCTTPVLTVILAYVAAQARLAYGVSLLLAYSVGFVVPLLLAGSFAGFLMGLKKLQERTQYREWIEKGSGVLLVLFALYLVKLATGH
jgi:cytochrome c-type biogenesis protein